MSLLSMPWVVVNLGCEMLYILEQRLKAQNIPPEKSCKVLQDVARTMFDKSFVDDKLFVPQEMYALNSTRKIFDRLAHSSIMRLSESRYKPQLLCHRLCYTVTWHTRLTTFYWHSMDKLFDLMVMGAKYQLLCCTRLDGLMEVGYALAVLL